MLLLGWLLAATPAAEPVVTPATSFQITFDGTADDEIRGALDDLRQGAFDRAARRFGALVDAGGGIDLRTLQAVSLYEAGDVRLAESATAEALALAPDHAPLLSLKGLILADLGHGQEALAALNAAAAHAGADADLKARIGLNRALVHLDRGEPAPAQAAVDAARKATTDPALRARLDDMAAQIAALRGEAAPDALGQVGDALSRGDLAAARAALAADPATDRRSQLRRTIAEAAIARAEGRYAAAIEALAGAANDAAAHGLLREQAAAEAQLGETHGAANRPELALDALNRAVKRVAGTSLRVAERAYRVEAGRMALRADDPGAAKRQLDAAAAIPSPDPAAAAALAELRGEIAARAGQTTAAAAAFAEAAAAFEARSAHMDAARVWVAAVELQAGTGDAGALAAARDRALAAFTAAGDPLGPAHVAVAEGLGLSRTDQLEAALKAFGRAVDAAEAAHAGRSEQIARVARERRQARGRAVGQRRPARPGRRPGHRGPRQARPHLPRGPQGLRRRPRRLRGRPLRRSRPGLRRAVQGMDGIGERAYAMVARRGRAWARFNAAAGCRRRLPVWQGLVEEGTLLGDAELRTRAMVAAALAAAEARPPRGHEVADGRRRARRPWAWPARRPVPRRPGRILPKLDDKVAAARDAYRLRNDHRGSLCPVLRRRRRLRGRALRPRRRAGAASRPGAQGDLAKAVREVLDAARASR
ncbi:MAG: hypothetical protein R3F59_26510 [Myxococcota bacterium]